MTQGPGFRNGATWLGLKRSYHCVIPLLLVSLGCPVGSRGTSSNAVFSVSFHQRSQGEYLASVEDNEYHTVTVWDWTRKKKITSARVRSIFIE